MLTGLRGGLEMLFSDQRQHKLALPAHDKDGKPVTVAYLIDYLCQHVMKDNRKELFVLDRHMYAHTPYSWRPKSLHLPRNMHGIDIHTPL